MQKDRWKLAEYTLRCTLCLLQERLEEPYHPR